MKFLAAIVAAFLSSASLMAKDAESSKPMTVIPPFRDDWKLVEIRPPESKEIWLFRKNLGVAEVKGLKGLPTLVYFTIQFVPEDATGLPNKTDTKTMYDFEEDVIPKVERGAGCVLVGSVVKGGVKDHLFYVSDPDLFMQIMNNHRKTLQEFKVSFEKHEDAKWEVYDDFPEGK